MVTNSNMVPGLSSKPFYLISPKGNMRAMIVSGLMLLLLGLVNPFILIPFLIYLIYIIFKIREYKSEANIQLENAIESFVNKDYDNAFIILKTILGKQPDNNKAKAMLAIIEYEKGNYNNAIDLITDIPEKYIEGDFDLKLKLGESYLKENRLQEAKNVYEKMYKAFPNSKFLKDNIDKLK